jgi:hypothetical protein
MEDEGCKATSRDRRRGRNLRMEAQKRRRVVSEQLNLVNMRDRQKEL